MRMYLLPIIANFVFSAALAFTTGCLHDPVDVNDAEVMVNTSALSASDVDSVVVTVSGPGMGDMDYDLSFRHGVWQGVLGAIPVGTGRTFHAEAFDGATLIYEGEATNVTIARGSPTSVRISLQQVTPNPSFENEVPFIEAISVSGSPVEPGNPVALSVDAHDGDGELLSLNWDAESGTFDNEASSMPIWTAPATEGTYALTITATDPHGAFDDVTFSVVVRGRGTAFVEAEFNTWPEVTSVTATPGRVDQGEVVALNLTASDPDSDTLSFTWTDGGCGGTFTNTSAEDPSWTAPESYPAGGDCTLTATITDGRGGSNQGSVTVHVAMPTDPDFAPVIDSTFQSTDDVLIGDVVELRVTAHDPDGDALAFMWSAADGTLGTQTDTAEGSEITWTAPNHGGVTPFTVRVVVSDESGQETTVDFELRPLSSACDWVMVSPTNHPDQRSVAAFVHDPIRNTDIIFGGANTSILGDTWAWDGTNWTSLSPGTAPSARTWSTMAFDEQHSVIVLYGGLNQSMVVVDDTWHWNGLTWIEQAPANHPSPRYSPALAYDSNREVAVLFGGRLWETNTYYNETWEYDGTTWTQRTPVTQPPGRNHFRMVYDSHRQVTVLFGGEGEAGFLNDTWEWDGTNWRQVETVSAPSERAAYGMGYDSRRHIIVLFGGRPLTMPPNSFSDTWEYDGTAWNQITTTTTPPERGLTALSYDSNHGVMTMFGGDYFPGSWQFRDDTWEYTCPD